MLFEPVYYILKRILLQPNMTKLLKDVLLPAYVSPLHYSIYLEPDLENFIFIGEETIDIELKKEVGEITLHSADIEVLSMYVTFKEETVPARKISYNDKAETVTFAFSSKVPHGKAQIKIKFSGILNDKMRGFYRSRYDYKGKTYHMGVTQFESTDARRAFPCFDEPAHKATFDVSLKVPSDRTVISNTLEEEIVEHEGGYKVVRFEKSPKMSSYLLAFIVGHFEYVETKSREGIKVRVYVTPGKKKQAEFALESASKIMDFYHDYFGIAYPLPTMDLIAIPDFANGAMENWGAVTYRETALLVDPEHSSLHTKQWVALVIAHELAHQWFGNLVTMKWWTHLWLNEGFASFMEYLAVDELFPEWRVWTQFVYTEQARALSLDGLTNTHAIEIPVHHPGEISEIFDAVSYSKGASVIRMLQAYVGEANFQKGLSHYLKKHQYSNAETEDLWRALEKVSGKPVQKIMKNWTSKPGYPLISVDNKNGKLTFSQERFFASGKPDKSTETKWIVPISTVTSESRAAKQYLLTGKKMTVEGFKKDTWVKANADETSFVRIKYTREILQSLEKPVSTKTLSEEGRFALVRDAFALAEAGYISSDEALELVVSYRDEDSYIVWAEIALHILEYKSLLFGTDLYDAYLSYGKSVLEGIALRAGWHKKKSESHEETLLRSTTTYALGSLGDSETINKAKELFAVRESKSIDSDMRGLVYALVAENGGRKEHKIFQHIYATVESEEEKDRALRALCSFADPQLLKETLNVAFSKNARAQDAIKVIYLMANNPIGIDIAWDYIQDHWSELHERFAGGHLFARFISPFSKYASKDKAIAIEKFFQKNKAEGIERTVAQTVEKINSNAELLKRDTAKIRAFLNE